MVPADVHDFFLASGGVAGALIGLLFVAISVSAERLTRQNHDTQLHRVRASAALTAFTNALIISLFALIPGHKIGPTAVIVAAVGLAFVAGALLSLRHLRQAHWGTVRDAVFLLGLVATFVIQLIQGVEVSVHPANSGDVNTIAALVVVCFLIGIARAWELIGGPSIGLSQQVTVLVREHNHEPATSEDSQPPPS
ncbi:MAG: hypothetical protein ACRDN1_09885 [Trebonia sp.]